MAISMLAMAKSDPGGCPCDMGFCLCGPEERAVRCFKQGQNKAPMTPEQREECLREIGQVEGYDRKDYEASPDPELANGVLSAWLDYCRDKGLIQ